MPVVLQRSVEQIGHASSRRGRHVGEPLRVALRHLRPLAPGVQPSPELVENDDESERAQTRMGHDIGHVVAAREIPEVNLPCR